MRPYHATDSSRSRTDRFRWSSLTASMPPPLKSIYTVYTVYTVYMLQRGENLDRGPIGASMKRVREFTEADRPALLDLLKVHGPTNVPRLAKLRGVNLN